MKKALLTLQVVLSFFLIISLYLGIMELTNGKVPYTAFDHFTPKYNGRELFDPSLARLSSIDKLTEYCDSIYKKKIAENPTATFEETYPPIASFAVRNRFYHGYSSYSVNDNYMALALEPFTGKWMSAIVLPDDIMKYPYAACSQQSIVTMELLKRKGFTTRKIIFINGKENGHFAFETYYKGSWHFSDPNLEPNRDLLISRNNPSVATLAADKELLLAAYAHLPREKVLAIFGKFSYGVPNRFPAPRAAFYQHTTKVLSYISWIFFLIAFLLVRKRYLREVSSTLYYVRYNRFQFPSFKKRRSTTYYPDVRASRA